MRSTLSILYFIKKAQVKSNGLTSIMIRITIDGEKVQFYSRIDVDPLQWDQKAQKIRGRSVYSKQLNHSLEQTRMQMYLIYSQLLTEGDYIAPSKIRDAFLSNEIESTLVYQFKRHNEHYRDLIPGKITRATYTRYELTLSRLIEFMQFQYGISDIQIHKITLQFIEQYSLLLKLRKNGQCPFTIGG